MSVSHKHILRTQLREKRSAIQPNVARAKSRAVCQPLHGVLQHLQGAIVQSGTTVCPLSVAVYTPVNHEVDITAFINEAYHAGCTVSFPSLNARPCTRPMDMRRVPLAAYEARTAPFIASPIKPYDAPAHDPAFPVTDPQSLDMIVVPMVGFDATGIRLGYGGGNYDQYLPLVTPSCAVVGVAFSEQRVDAIPHDPHDVALARIIHA